MKLQEIKDACKKCGASCCKMGGPAFLKKEMLMVVKKHPGYKKHFSKINNDHYELKVKGGFCPFLTKDYACSIHGIRPLMCKCWPVYKEYNNRTKYIIIQCPITPHLSKKQIQTMKKQASKIPRELSDMVETNLPKKEVKLIKKRFKKFKKKNLK